MVHWMVTSKYNLLLKATFFTVDHIQGTTYELSPKDSQRHLHGLVAHPTGSTGVEGWREHSGTGVEFVLLQALDWSKNARILSPSKLISTCTELERENTE